MCPSNGFQVASRSGRTDFRSSERHPGTKHEASRKAGGKGLYAPHIALYILFIPLISTLPSPLVILRRGWTLAPREQVELMAREVFILRATIRR